MTILQLELNLWQQLAEAQQSPQTVDWQQLCLAFDIAMDDTPVGLRLATAADAIVEMADVFAARADEFFSGWHQQRVAHEGPIIDDDLFDEFVRQSFHLDLDDLVGVPELYVRSVSEKSHEDAESVVEYREKAEVLAELETFVSEGAGSEVKMLEYDEDIAAWAETIRGWLKKRGLESAVIVELQQGTGLSLVKLWLAGLLGGFGLEQSGGFYEGVGVAIGLR